MQQEGLEKSALESHDFTFGRPALKDLHIRSSSTQNSSASASPAPYRVPQYPVPQQHLSSVSARRSSSPQINLPALTVQRPSHPAELAPIRESDILPRRDKHSISPTSRSPLFPRRTSGIHLPFISPTGSPTSVAGYRQAPSPDAENGEVDVKPSYFALPRIHSPFLRPQPPSHLSSDSGGSDSSASAHRNTMSTSNSPDRSRMEMRPDSNGNGSLPMRQPSPSGTASKAPLSDILGPTSSNKSSPFRMGPAGEVSRTLAPLPVSGYERRGSASGTPMQSRDHSVDPRAEGTGRNDAEAEEARDKVGDPADFDYSMRRHSIAVFHGEDNGPLRPLAARPPPAPSPLGLGANNSGLGMDAENEAARLAMNRKRKESHDRAAMGHFGDAHLPGFEPNGGPSRIPNPSAPPANHVFQPPAPPSFSNPFASSTSSATSIPSEELGPPAKRRGSTYDTKMRQLSLSGTHHDSHPGSAGMLQNASPQPWNPAFGDRRDSTVSVYSTRSLASSMSSQPSANPMNPPYPPYGTDPTQPNHPSGYPAYPAPPPPGSMAYPPTTNHSLYQDPRGSASSVMSSSTAVPDHARADRSNQASPDSNSGKEYTPVPVLSSLPPETRDSIVNGLSAPYSRSPELRVSHKLAERKRRKEMKDLFDELKEQLPADRGMKSSKWEILTRAVDFIANLKRQNSDMTREIEGLRAEVNTLRVGAAAAAAASGVTYGVPPPPHYPMSLGSGPAYNLPPAGYAPPVAAYPPMGSANGSAPPSHGGTPVPR
ncbi:hypothetical protein NliqN6_5107 [Naganishia liquefaciens]|uniref:BHLH domain-containing protein n=1 Tax=Naganishia liquefaciens TaxID=104408 RepID=A0A8H3YGD0_9TREE|nr:hypothetical protein NliqN6_5107 [Naganishia liquefaciens]